MKISTIKHFTTDAAKSLKRNSTLSIASMATVAATLFIFGVFMLIILNVNKGAEQLGSKLEVKIYLNDEITDVQRSKIEDSIKNTQGISNIEYEDKAKALENVKEQLGKDSEDLVAGFEENNPFPNAYIVTVKEAEDVTNVVQSVEGLQGIEKVKDARDIVDKIIKITKTIKWSGIIIFMILFAVSLFLIGNTIKLTVFSRKREISIMKYVGATDWFIRWPFVIEGIMIGFIGSMISSTILYYAYKAVFAKTAQAMLMLQLISPDYVLGNLLWKFVLSGIIIGAFGSIMAIRKFLKV